MNHGDITHPGDEFNRDDMMHCAVCGSSHTRGYTGCDGLRKPPPNPVQPAHCPHCGAPPAQFHALGCPGRPVSVFDGLPKYTFPSTKLVDPDRRPGEPIYVDRPSPGPTPLTGGKLSGEHYYRVRVPAPIAPDVKAYTAECADIIEALGLTFNEGEAFKALWRLAAARQGRGKPGNKAQYDADKVAHYGERVRVQTLTGSSASVHPAQSDSVR